MRGSDFLPKQLKALSAEGPDGQPSWLSKRVTSTLLPVCHQACMHPIHTLVFIALLASTSYVGLLQQSLFETTQTNYGPGHVDVEALLEGGRTLQLSGQTGWKWHLDETSSIREDEVRFLLYSSLYADLQSDCNILPSSP